MMLIVVLLNSQHKKYTILKFMPINSFTRIDRSENENWDRLSDSKKEKEIQEKRKRN